MKLRSIVPGALLVSLVIIAALLSYVWTPFDVTQLDIRHKFTSPGAVHWLGSDHLGRDILSMLMVGARTSLAVALVAVGIGMGVGVPLGLLAAARAHTWIDELIMRSNDLVFAFPALLIAIMITAVFGPGAINAIIAIGIFNIPVFARLTRGAAMSLWTREFILSARVAGKGAFRISLEHLLKGNSRIELEHLIVCHAVEPITIVDDFSFLWVEYLEGLSGVSFSIGKDFLAGDRWARC